MRSSSTAPACIPGSTGKQFWSPAPAGPVGSELARQLAQFNPGLLILLDISEFALYQVEQEFQRRYPQVRCAFIVGDVKDVAWLDWIYAHHRPSVVFHAAAYKHVPLMEGDNAWQAVRNNVVGSKRLAEAARHYGTDKVVLISTDKAVNPTNVMGATKRLAEARHLSAMQQERLEDEGGTRFITVPFRQRAGQQQLGDSDLSRTDCARRTHHGDASGDYPLLHAYTGGGAIGVAGRADGQGRRFSSSRWESRYESPIWRAT